MVFLGVMGLVPMLAVYMDGCFQPGDVPDTYADVDDLVEQFGYKPSMSEADIEKVIQEIKKFNA